jgi:DNA topoisomerase-1
MPGLTAKVFRTFNASFTFQEELLKTPGDASVSEKVLAYNRANRQVAILCNHQRTVPKSFETQMEKMSENILMLKFERYSVQLHIERLLKTSKSEVEKNIVPKSIRKFVDPDMDAATVKRKERDYVAREEERIAKRLEKKAEKDAMMLDGSSPLSKSVTKTKSSAVRPNDTDDEDFDAEKQNGKNSNVDFNTGSILERDVCNLANFDVGRLMKKFEQLSARIDNSKTQQVDKVLLLSVLNSLHC